MARPRSRYHPKGISSPLAAPIHSARDGHRRRLHRLERLAGRHRPDGRARLRHPPRPARRRRRGVLLRQGRAPRRRRAVEPRRRRRAPPLGVPLQGRGVGPPRRRPTAPAPRARSDGAPDRLVAERAGPPPRRHRRPPDPIDPRRLATHLNRVFVVTNFVPSLLRASDFPTYELRIFLPANFEFSYLRTPDFPTCELRIFLPMTSNFLPMNLVRSAPNYPKYPIMSSLMRGRIRTLNQEPGTRQMASGSSGSMRAMRRRWAPWISSRRSPSSPAASTS